MLFVAASEAGNLGAVLKATAGKPILTFGDSPGFSAAGVHINFIPVGDKINFEMNQATVAAAGIGVTPGLRKLAIVPTTARAGE